MRFAFERRMIALPAGNVQNGNLAVLGGLVVKNPSTMAEPLDRPAAAGADPPRHAADRWRRVDRQAILLANRVGHLRAIVRDYRRSGLRGFSDPDFLARGHFQHTDLLRPARIGFVSYARAVGRWVRSSPVDQAAGDGTGLAGDCAGRRADIDRP